VTEPRKVAVFGGTGFLGRRVVQHLLDRHFAVRVASRHPERGEGILRGKSSALEFVRANISDDGSISAVVAGTFGVVNAVSLYVEQGGPTFHSVHVEAAARVAMHSRDSDVARLAHVSGIGADAASPSPYIRSRGEGENAVRAAFPAATIIRPAIMFGPDDAFLIPLIKLLRKSPVFPLLGRGRTALQPACVEDVGDAIVRSLDAPQAETVYELGGPQIYSYEDVLRLIGEHLGSRRVLVPVPFVIWQALAFLAEGLPRPPITRNQVELMRMDNVASPACAGFGTLGIEPHGIEEMLRHHTIRHHAI
jgi:uncharacterized protein YbjT (DUF2867 family)